MILVTGKTGFIGKAVVQRLLAEDESRRVAVALRRDNQQWPAQVLPRVTGDLEPSTDWPLALEGVSAVVHCAARVHVMAADPLETFRRVNVRGPLKPGPTGCCSRCTPVYIRQFHQGQRGGD